MDVKGVGMEVLVSRRQRVQMLVGYGIAIASVAACLIVSLAFQAVFKPSPFLLFWLAIAFSAWFGGLGPGLAATGLSLLSTTYFFLEPENSFRVETSTVLVRLILFASEAFIICWLFQILRRSGSALRLSRNELNIILQSIGDGVTAQDPTGRLVYANDAAARISGFTSGQEMLAAPIETITQNFEIRDEFGQPFPMDRLPGRLALQGQQSQAAVLRFWLKGIGEERWSIVKATPVFDEYGQVELAINLFQDITDFKRTEKSLYEQREWLRVTLSSIGDAVVTTDINGRLTFMNPLASELTGWPPNEAVGHHIRDVLHIVNEATRETVENPLERALREGIVVGLANHSLLIARDGTERPIDDSGAPILDMQGNTIGAVMVFRDITERRKVELAIRESEARFRTMADTAPVLIWVAEPDSLRSYCNKPWLEFTGRTMEQELGNGWAEGVHPDDREQCLNTYTTAFNAREPFTMEYRLRHADGEYCWMLEKGVPRFATDGTFAGYIGSCIDITERKQAEETRLFLAAIVENTRDAIIGKTLAGTIVSWNRGAELIYGYSAEEAVGQPVTMLFLPDRLDEFDEIMDMVSRGRSVIQRETRRIKKDGTIIDISLTVSPIIDASGKIIGASTIAQNITERKRIEAQEREQRQLAEALRDTANALNSTLNLSKVLDRIFVNVRQVVPHDAAEIMMVEGDMAHVERCHGYDESYLENTPTLQISKTASLRYMVENCQPLILSDVLNYPDWIQTPVSQEQGWRSYVGAPICFKGEVMGFLNLISFSPGFFTPTHIDWLSAFAEQAAIAIRNARLYEQEQTLAALQERQRLARDLHDAVSQTLFSATVVAEALARQKNYTPEKMQKQLGELHHLTRGALAEMRSLLLELRPNSLMEVRVGDLLRQLADAVRSRKRLTIEINVDNDFDLPPDVKQVFYRIAQEALNNIAKHSKATKVVIDLRCEEEKIEMSIIDNGQGFDPSQVVATSMGLGIMRERADGIGAVLTVSSEVGNGTRVNCSLAINSVR